jgi:hypothetical protein
MKGDSMATFVQTEQALYINMDWVRSIEVDQAKSSIWITWSDMKTRQLSGDGYRRVLDWVNLRGRQEIE